MMRLPVTRSGLLAATVNLCLALFYVAFAVAHVQSLAASPRLSVALALAFETLAIVFVFARRAPLRTWHSWNTWITTVGGTLGPLLLRPLAGDHDVAVGLLLQLVGVSLQLGAILSLNRSFGLLPAERRVKSDGLYRVVRHPLYAAYTVSLLGYLVNNPSAWNVAAIIVATGFQVLRIRNEERFLLQAEAYQAYTQATRWRLLPMIW